MELVLAGMVCVVSFGESARVMKDDTSGGNCIRLSCLSLLGMAEGSSVWVDVVGGETTAVCLGEADSIGACIVGTDSEGSSRSELRRGIEGGDG